MRHRDSQESAGATDPIEQARASAARDLGYLARCFSGELDGRSPVAEAAFDRVETLFRFGSWQDWSGSRGADRLLAVYGGGS